MIKLNVRFTSLGDLGKYVFLFLRVGTRAERSSRNRCSKVDCRPTSWHEAHNRVDKHAVERGFAAVIAHYVARV